MAILTADRGFITLIFEDEIEAGIYNTDPDGYAARHFGISRQEYLDWIESFGRPRCAARTKKGKWCKNAGARAANLSEWLALDRTCYCHIHGGEKLEDIDKYLKEHRMNNRAKNI